MQKGTLIMKKSIKYNRFYLDGIPENFQCRWGLSTYEVCKINSYSFYRRSYRVIFLPFTESKGTQNVSRGIRLLKPQNKFHALTKESFCFCNFHSSASSQWRYERSMQIPGFRPVSPLCSDIDLFPSSNSSQYLSNVLQQVSSLFLFLFFYNFEIIVSS